LDQMDARAEELERPLNDDDVAHILRGYGKPEVVALRYLPQRSLIGPTVFPFYSHTMVRVVPVVIFVNAIAAGIRFASTSGLTFAQTLGDFVSGAISSLAITLVMMTAVFAVIEWALASGKAGTKWNEWDPKKLSPVRSNPPSLKSMGRRVSDLMLHCVWMAYVLWAPWHPFWVMGPGIFYFRSLDITWAPAWHVFYALLIALLTVQLIMHLLAFISSAQRLLEPMKIATDLLGLIAIGWLASGSTYFVATGPAANLRNLADVNHGVGIAFRIALVIAIAGWVRQAWQYAKRWKPLRQMVF